MVSLAKLPKSRKFVEPFLAPPAEEIARQEAKQISVKQPSRVERPSVNRGIFSAFTSPNGLILLGALFLSNLYAAFTIARFRHRPAALVCGVSAVMPLIGPVIFLALPKAHSESAHADEGSAETATVAMAASTAENRVGGTLGIGREKSVAEGLPRVFPRGEFTFNKRFFETQFPSFFRVVTSESDRDLVIDVAAGKNSLIASRISRISSNEIHFKNTAGHEMGVNFSEITGITLRNKDQK